MTRAPEEILNDLIPQIAEEQNFIKYESIVKSISSGGANYATTLYTITISEGDRVLNMFAKVAAAGDPMRLQAPNMYENEIFAYTELIKTYQRLEDEYQVPQEHRLALPKFYGYNPTKYEETIVLEDLLKLGFEPFNRFDSIDLPYAKAALKQLAQIHALGFAYSEKYPEEFEKVLEDIMFKWNIDESMKIYFKIMVDKAVSVTREPNKEKLQKYFENYEMNSYLEYYTVCRRKVLGHGDFRPSNLMHKNLDEGSLDVKIVDFQTLQGTSPVIDLLYFLFLGSDEDFRAQHYDEAIEFYYAELHAAMKRLELDPDSVYSKEDFQKELKKKLGFGLTIAVFLLPVITVAEENAPKVDKNIDISSFSVEKTSKLYSERMNGVVNDYIKWGILE